MKKTLLSLFILSGCSHVSEIQKNTNTVRSLAQSSKQRFETINNTVVEPDPDLSLISDESKKGIEDQVGIIKKSDSIIEATAGVKDITPWWAEMITISMLAAILIGASILLWQSGLGIAIRRLVSWIPENKKNQAKLLTEALDPEHETTMREAVAAMRAGDPLLDAAFKAVKPSA